MNDRKELLNIPALILTISGCINLAFGHLGTAIILLFISLILYGISGALANVNGMIIEAIFGDEKKIISTFIVIDNGRYFGVFNSTKTAWMDIAQEFHDQVVLPRTQAGFDKTENNAIRIFSRSANFYLEPFQKEMGMTAVEYTALSRDEQEEVYLKWARSVEVIA
jgi:enamine deaminase RidA (YjgF/YER057c/UK114 family)